MINFKSIIFTLLFIPILCHADELDEFLSNGYQIKQESYPQCNDAAYAKQFVLDKNNKLENLYKQSHHNEAELSQPYLAKLNTIIQRGVESKVWTEEQAKTYAQPILQSSSYQDNLAKKETLNQLMVKQQYGLHAVREQLARGKPEMANRGECFFVSIIKSGLETTEQLTKERWEILLNEFSKIAAEKHVNISN